MQGRTSLTHAPGGERHAPARSQAGQDRVTLGCPVSDRSAHREQEERHSPKDACSSGRLRCNSLLLGQSWAVSGIPGVGEEQG